MAIKSLVVVGLFYLASSVESNQNYQLLATKVTKNFMGIMQLPSSELARFECLNIEYVLM